MEMLQGVWKQYLRPRAVVGYGVKIFLPSPPNYVTRSPGQGKGFALIICFPVGQPRDTPGEFFFVTNKTIKSLWVKGKKLMTNSPSLRGSMDTCDIVSNFGTEMK